MNLSRVVYCKFVDASGAPMAQELARLAEPEDLSGLSRAMEFVELACGSEKVHTVGAEGRDEDSESYARRVADKLPGA